MIDFLTIIGAILLSVFATAMILLLFAVVLIVWNDEWVNFKLNKFKLTEWEIIVAKRNAEKKYEKMQEEKRTNREKKKIRQKF